MKKWLRNRNVLLLAGLLAVIALVLIASMLVISAPDAPSQLPEAADGAPLGYIRAQANGESKWIPLPAGEEDLLITITRQDDPGITNTLRLKKNGFLMDSSTCANQDCVMQGEVTLENKDQRVLRNAVLCLPHDVIVELYSLEELIQGLEQGQ